MTRPLLPVTLALALLPACLPVPQHAKSWDAFPIRLLLSDALSDCQVQTMHSAAAHIERVAGQPLFDLELVPSSNPAVNGLPGYRVIGVSSQVRSTPEALEEANVFIDPLDGRIQSCEIRLGDHCSFRGQLHEALHCLGLDHSTAEGNIMLEQHDESAMAITPAQVQAVLIGTYTRLAITKPRAGSARVMGTVKP